MSKIKAFLCASVAALGLNAAPILLASAHATPTGCAVGQPVGEVAGLGCVVHLTAQDYTVTGSTIPANGMYLPSANTLGFSVNGVKWLTMESAGGGPEYIFGDPVSGTTESLFIKGSSGNHGRVKCADGDSCWLTSYAGYMILESNGANSFLVGDTSQHTRVIKGLTVGANSTKTANPGEIATVGTAPTPTGTGSPTMASGSTDTAGEVTSGSSATSVVITFANAKTNAPFCTVTPQTQLIAFAYTISTSAITITQTATSGEKIDYVCFQH